MRFFVLLLCLVWPAAALPAAPTPRELVHPFPPTGPHEVAGAVRGNRVMRAMQRYSTSAFTDLLALHVAHTLQDAADAPAVVTRKHRQLGNVALSYVSAAAPDGRTVLFAPVAGAARDALTPVAMVATMPYVVVTTADVPWKTLGEVFRDAVPRESRLLFASPGGTSAGHAALSMLRSRQRVPVEAVTYNGGNAALQAVATQQVVASFVPLPTVLPYLPAGRVRAIAIADVRRHEAIPEVRTSAEAGYAGFIATGSFGVFAPKATPRETVRELDAKLVNVATRDAAELFSALGLRLGHQKIQ